MDGSKTDLLLLAYLGDAVWEVLVRTALIQTCPDSASCNKKALDYVQAKNQAAAAKRIRELFTEEEEALFLHAKNAKAHSVPKTTDLYTYRLATALESLIGWLYQRGDNDRIRFLFQAAFPDLSDA